MHAELPYSLPSHIRTRSDVRHAFFAAFIIGSLVQILGQLLRVFTFDGEKLLKEVCGCLPRHDAWRQPGSCMCHNPPSPSPLPPLCSNHNQDRGHKELGTAARFKHLVYVLVMLGLGLVWTSDSQV